MRIIPAGAGKSTPPGTTHLAEWDHPRGCGEKVSAAFAVSGLVGSSPRVRGKEKVLATAPATVGIIPAGAGKSVGLQLRGGRRGDHPRGCGEKEAAKAYIPDPAGSSPRVRGKASGAGMTAAVSGIIPAGAGKSAGLRGPEPHPEDHPRGCGEKSGV